MTAFGPPAASVVAQLEGNTDLGLVVATLDEGRSDVHAYGAAFTGDSRLEIGSVTKTFTATLFADMILRHEVRADDPIERYLPPDIKAPAFAGRSITLADLATQRSGLPRLPGSYYEYSNLGFGLLGELLARRLGTDYATAIRSRILKPLGMLHTDLGTAGRSMTTVGGHDGDGDSVPNWNFAALAGAGSLVSTPNDMLRYLRANLDTSHGPLGAAMALAQRPLVPADGDRRIGYAWMTNPDGVVWHNGGTAGFRTFAGFDPAHRRAIFVIANASIDAVDALGMHALKETVPLPPAPEPGFAVDRATLATYVGRYAFADGSTGVVTADGRGLSVVFDKPAFRARLHPVAAETFVIRAVPIRFRFVAEGTGMTLEVQQPGQALETGTRRR